MQCLWQFAPGAGAEGFPAAIGQHGLARKEWKRMGSIVKISCQSCKQQWDLQAGAGIMHGELENVAGLFPEGVKRVLMEAAGRQEYVGFDFAFQPAVCRNCAKFVSIPVVRLEEGAPAYVGVCPDCGKKTWLVKDLEKTHCPICRKGALTLIETGLWD